MQESDDENVNELYASNTEAVAVLATVGGGDGAAAATNQDIQSGERDRLSTVAGVTKFGVEGNDGQTTNSPAVFDTDTGIVTTGGYAE